MLKTLKLLKVYQDEPCLDIKVKSKINYWVKEFNGVKLGSSTVRIFNKGKIEDLKGYKEGQWWVQDIAAQLPVILMGNIKNKSILDLCAAPGGKSFQTICLNNNVTLNDISLKRINKLRTNLDRLDFNNEIKNYNAMDFPEE